jgi:hypothetical protein
MTKHASWQERAPTGHLLPDAEEYERGLLDAFDARADEAVAES